MARGPAVSVLTNSKDILLSEVESHVLEDSGLGQSAAGSVSILALVVAFGAMHSFSVHISYTCVQLLIIPLCIPSVV